MLLRPFFSLCIVILLLFIACNGGHVNNVDDNKQPDYKKNLETANKHLTKTEDTEIRDFIKRYGWNMNETGTGLRYMIYSNADMTRNSPEKGSIVKINYSISLINGNLCYTSDSTGPKIFEIGKGHAESGLEEGLMLLNKGDKAKFIIPSHLAFGLQGDMNRIPKRATLVYDVELLDIKQNHNN